MEAMGAGLPVVSSDAGALPEIFEDPTHGRFWPIDDFERGAEILIDLLDREPERRRAGRAAREKFRSDYDADVVAPRLIAFLRSGQTVAQDTSRGAHEPAEVRIHVSTPHSGTGSAVANRADPTRKGQLSRGERK
jgi:hypothetical protein